MCKGEPRPSLLQKRLRNTAEMSNGQHLPRIFALHSPTPFPLLGLRWTLRSPAPRCRSRDQRSRALPPSRGRFPAGCGPGGALPCPGCSSRALLRVAQINAVPPILQGRTGPRLPSRCCHRVRRAGEKRSRTVAPPAAATPEGADCVCVISERCLSSHRHRWLSVRKITPSKPFRGFRCSLACMQNKSWGAFVYLSI